jgi:sugar (glycoside-pentoside-hexuronide) transporter
MAQTKEEYLTSNKERMSYGVYFTGQLIFYGLILNFLLPYFTDIGIPALTVAGIALVVKVWDAVNDPIFGGIVDKVRFKKGKFLPWLKISVIAIPLATIFLFGAPLNVSLSFKIIWVTVGYILWDTAYTICDVPCFGLVTTMTNKVGERNYLLAITRIFSGIGLLIAIMVLPIIRTKIGGWLPTAIVLSLAGAVFMLPVLLSAKERYVIPVSENEFGIREIFTYLSKNKYLLMFYLGTIIYGSGNINLTMYIARHNLGQESMMALISLLSFIPGVLISFLLPSLVRKFDKFKMFFWSIVATAIVGVLTYFVGYKNLTPYLVMTFIRGVASGSIMMFVNMFTPDMIEYGRYKTGIAASGISFATQTFAAKLHSAFATALAALCLSLIGFVEGEGAIQPGGFADKLWFVSCIIPVTACLLAIPVYAQYKLRDKYVAVMVQCNNGETNREEAEKLLEGKIS